MVVLPTPHGPNKPRVNGGSACETVDAIAAA
jgi:hypothetical protein